MKAKKLLFILCFVFCLAAGTLLHFTYGWSGGAKWVGLFSPVNESVWEHTKIVAFPLLIMGIFLFIKQNGEIQNFFVALASAITAAVITIPLLFYAYNTISGKPILVLDLIIFVIACFVGVYTFFYITEKPPLPERFSYLGAAALMIIVVLYAVITYTVMT